MAKKDKEKEAKKAAKEAEKEKEVETGAEKGADVDTEEEVETSEDVETEEEKEEAGDEARVCDLNGNTVRVYSKKAHGKDFKKLALGFAGKVLSKGIERAKEAGLAVPTAKADDLVK